MPTVADASQLPELLPIDESAKCPGFVAFKARLSDIVRRRDADALRMAKMPMGGITFRDMYFVHPSYSSESLHFHELVHVVQWSTLGAQAFLLTYALGIVQHGYADSPLEAMAFDLQARFEQGTAMRSVAEEVARHAVEARDAASTVFRGHGLELGV